MAKQCRICYDETNEEKNRLVEPCACKGSAQYVHELCLRFWIRIDPAKNAEACPVCLATYDTALTRREVIPTERTITLIVLYNPVVSGCIGQFSTLLIFTSSTYTPTKEMQLIHYAFQLFFFLCFYLNAKVTNVDLYKSSLLKSYMPIIVLSYLYYSYELLFQPRPMYFLTTNTLLSLTWQEHIRTIKRINELL
jgi:hypothetical protein